MTSSWEPTPSQREWAICLTLALGGTECGTQASDDEVAQQYLLALFRTADPKTTATQWGIITSAPVLLRPSPAQLQEAVKIAKTRKVANS